MHSSWPLILTRYVNYGLRMRRQCRERFPRQRGLAIPTRFNVTHVPWCMSRSLTSGFLWSRWRGKRSRPSRRMRNPQLYVSGKRPMLGSHGHTFFNHSAIMATRSDGGCEKIPSISIRFKWHNVICPGLEYTIWVVTVSSQEWHTCRVCLVLFHIDAWTKWHMLQTTFSSLFSLKSNSVFWLKFSRISYVSISSGNYPIQCGLIFMTSYSVPRSN